MLDWYFQNGERSRRGTLIGDQDRRELGAPQAIPINVWEGDESLVIAAAMPGIEADDLEISVLGDELRLRAEERGPGQERKEYLLREWSYGPYERRLRLPYAVDADKANASLGNGVLVLMLPRSEATRPRKISLTKTGPAEGRREGR